ncbi:MAG: hypothetical protein ACIAXF_16090 [Phycisphaerales bacterium JB063]
MKTLSKQQSLGITGLLVVLTIVAGGLSYTRSQKHQGELKQLKHEIENVPGRPATTPVLSEMHGVDDALNALANRSTSTHLRHCSQAMEEAGLAERSVTTEVGIEREGMLLTRVKFHAVGTQEAIFKVLSAPPLNCDGVLIERCSMTKPGASTDEQIRLELELIIAKPK